jgi:NAD(P)-dependent dehydrogenase (short-subunit alcohol dehydrogenase family)
MSEGSLEGKVAIVTGAGTGIGRGIAVQLAGQGATVVVHFNASEEGARETVRMIEGAPPPLAQRANLEEPDACAGLVSGIVQRQGRIDILVNNAAVSTEAMILDVTEDLWNMTINVNLRAPFFCSKEAARAMIPHGSGKIVNIGSVHGSVSFPACSAYAASKGGLNMLTKQMAIELAPHHICVNCVAPGTIEVERYFTQFGNYERGAAAESIPIGRVGLPQDIACIVGFLCTDEADFITGQTIIVDGGQTSIIPSSRPKEAFPWVNKQRKAGAAG